MKRLNIAYKGGTIEMGIEISHNEGMPMYGKATENKHGVITYAMWGGLLRIYQSEERITIDNGAGEKEFSIEKWETYLD